MTFEQFQATRTPCDNLGGALSDARWKGEPAGKGNLYLGGLYIEQVQPHWPEAVRAQGQWHLVLHNNEWIDNDLTVLERRLYDWAVSESYAP